MDELVTELYRVTEAISELPLDGEQTAALLEQLQRRQIEIRARIEAARTPDHSLGPEEKRVLEACLKLEERNIRQFTAMKEEAARRMRGIRDGSKARKLYRHQSQYDGFFVDKYK